MRKKSMRFISAALAACMMASTLPVGAFALEGDTAPESGVSTQAEETVAETVTTIPTETKVYTIAEGGNYELLGGNYGRIEINMTDTTKPVNITIKGNVAETLDDPLFNVTNAGVVNIVNEGYEVDCATGTKHLMYMRSPESQVTITGGTYVSQGYNIIMDFSGTLIVNDAKMKSNAYCIYAGSSGVVTVNGGEYTYCAPVQDRSVFFGEAGGTITLNDVTATSIEKVLKLENSTAIVNGGNFKSIGSKSCFVLSASSLTINEGTTTKGEFESESASCINNRGFVEINGGTFTSGAESTIYNRGGLRMTSGTVANTNADGIAIDISGNYGDIKLIGGTIKGIKDGIYVRDLGSSEVTLQQVTFEGSQNDIHLGKGQQINIKKTFTGKAKILVDDAKAGRRITQENDDTRYQKDLNLYKDKPLAEPWRGDWNDCVRWERDGHSYHAQTAPSDESYIQQLRAGYYAAITHMDHQIGRLVSALVEEQIMDNTIILFVSDHGEMLGDHLMFQKAKPFQGSIHVPLFISGPERYVGKHGTVRTDLAELRDVCPRCWNWRAHRSPKPWTARACCTLLSVNICTASIRLARIPCISS